MDSRPRHTGASPERRSSDRSPHSQAGNDELRRTSNRLRAEQSASTPSSEGMHERRERHANTSGNDHVINFLQSVAARMETNNAQNQRSGVEASEIQPVSEQEHALQRPPEQRRSESSIARSQYDGQSLRQEADEDVEQKNLMKR